jgi:hypothetical protein
VVPLGPSRVALEASLEEAIENGETSQNEHFPLGMGSKLSTVANISQIQHAVQDELSGIHCDSRKMETMRGTINETRLLELMQALQRIARLQKTATSARIDLRQKRRAASFKRQAVWVCDAKFMGEVQRLMAQGKLADFEGLSGMAAECQNARDGLGPLEQEGIEAEQQWEGQIWRLRQAEEGLYAEFEDEFNIAESYPPGPTSVTSSAYRSSSSDVEGQDFDGDDIKGQAVIPHQAAASIASSSSFAARPPWLESSAKRESSDPQNTSLLGLKDAEDQNPEANVSNTNSDSGIADLDDQIEKWSPGELIGPPQALPDRHYASIEVYPHLFTDFESRRDRVNSWLENAMLVSHFEAISVFTGLKIQLEAENQKLPSNWSELVIAYWELDGAAIPQFRQAQSQASVIARNDENEKFKGK